MSLCDLLLNIGPLVGAKDKPTAFQMKLLVSRKKLSGKHNFILIKRILCLEIHQHFLTGSPVAYTQLIFRAVRKRLSVLLKSMDTAAALQVANRTRMATFGLPICGQAYSNAVQMVTTSRYENRNMHVWTVLNRQVVIIVKATLKVQTMSLVKILVYAEVMHFFPSK